MSAAAATVVSYVLGEFEHSDALLGAAAALRQEDVGTLDTHTPYPVSGIDEALGLPRSAVGWVAFGGGLTGALLAYGMQLYFNWYEYPLNIANRPPHSPPVYVPVTFELMVLFSSLSIVVGLIVYFWQLPRPHHPVFEHQRFVETASTSSFWLSVETSDAERASRARQRLEALGAQHIAVIAEVPRA